LQSECEVNKKDDAEYLTRERNRAALGEDAMTAPKTAAPWVRIVGEWRRYVADSPLVLAARVSSDREGGWAYHTFDATPALPDAALPDVAPWTREWLASLGGIVDTAESAMEAADALLRSNGWALQDSKRIADPWMPLPNNVWVRPETLDVLNDAARVAQKGAHGWSWEVRGTAGFATTADEAMAAADEWLRTNGWTLHGSGPRLTTSPSTSEATNNYE
jgi:hypothetical protein